MKKTSVKLIESVLCLGLFVGGIGYYRYSTSADFNPVVARGFNRNVVEASGNRKTDSESMTEGNLWKKDENSVRNEQANEADNSNQFTEENQNQDMPQQVTASSVNSKEAADQNVSENRSENNDSNDENAGADTVIDIIDNPSDLPGKQPDIILPSEPGSDNGGGTTVIPGNGSENPLPGSGGKPSTEVTKPSYAPDYQPDETVKDPDVDDDNPQKGSGNTESKPYYEGLVKNPEDEKSFHLIVESTEGATYQLYEGGTFSDRYIYYSLDTYFMGADLNQYELKEKDYGSDNLFVIDWISFDGGNTKITKFPVTVPSGISEGNVQIGYRYRFSKNSSWISDVLTDVIVNRTRVYLLKTDLSGKNHSIQNDMIVNRFDQYPAEGSVFVTNQYQEKLFRMNGWLDSNGSQTVLFPGWYEDGKNVGNYYRVTAGRHILQPGKTIKIPDGMALKLKCYFLTPEYVNDLLADDSVDQYIQTLTSFDQTALLSLSGTGEMKRKLVIPEYVQAIDLDQSFSMTCGWMEIPDTVVCINKKTTPLYVTDGFIVDEGNPRYSSKDGLLLSKDGTEIEAIPYGKQSITVASGIRTVHFSDYSNVKEITVLANNMKDMPEMDLDNLDGALIHVQSSVLDEFMKKNLDVLAEKGIRVTAVSDPDTVYTVTNSMVIQNQDILYRCYIAADEMVMPSGIHEIAGGAFSGSSVRTVVMADDGTVVSFGNGSFDNSEVNTIVSVTRKQEEEISRFLENSGRTDISVVLSSVSADGSYQYYEENGQYVLVKAIKNVEFFDGSMELDNGETVYVSSIATGAFKDSHSLKYVCLNESVKKIGAQAFMNCNELEAVFIDSKDTITIGNQAFDGCEYLRFIGSNAHTGIMENNYNPLITDKYGGKYFYVPTDNEGYASNCLSFTVQSGVYSYAVIDGKFLYGCDEDGNPWLLLRALCLSGKAEIAKTTIEIWSNAFAGIHNAFTVDSENLDSISIYLDSMAFYDSGITDVNIDRDYINVYDSCFRECHDLKEITFRGTTDIDENVFDNCTSLEKVFFGTLTPGSLRTNMFYECDSLREIDLDGYYSYYDNGAPSLLVMPGNPFRFNENWTTEEETQNLSIHLGEWIDPESVLAAWRYPFLGYVSADSSAYISLWQDTYFRMADFESFYIPDDQEVDAQVYAELLGSESRIRQLLGLEKKDTVIPYVIYSQQHNRGEPYKLTIRGTTDDMESIDLDEELDLPFGNDYQILIRTDAFAKCPGLNGIFLSSYPVTLEDGFLKYTECKEVGLWALDGDLPSLSISEEGVPYSFGIDDSRINFMSWSHSSMSEYLNAWEYPLIGYSSKETFERAMKEQVKEENPDLEEDSEKFSEKLKERIGEQEDKAKERIRTIVSYLEDDTETDQPGSSMENTEEDDTKETDGEPDTTEMTETEKENDY